MFVNSKSSYSDVRYNRVTIAGGTRIITEKKRRYLTDFMADWFIGKSITVAARSNA
jgi:hypothetical protein